MLSTPSFNILVRPPALAVILSLLISILTYSHLGHAIRPGPDGSYQYAFNFFFDNNTQIGKDILFTYGPFGFLLWPQPIGNNLLFATTITVVTKFTFILTALLLNNQVKIKTHFVSTAFIIGFTFLVALQISLHNLLIFLPVLLLLLHNFSNKIFPLVIASIVVSCALMVKASAGILSLLALTSYLIMVTIRDRRPQPLLISVLTLVSTFLVTWFLLYKNLNGVLDYFIATLEFSVGNSSAMTINPKNNWWLITIFILSFFLLPLALKDKNIQLLYMVLMLTGAAFFKYAFSREDHVGHLLYYVFQFLYVLFIVSLSIEKKHLIAASVVFLALLLFIHSSPYKSSIPSFYQSLLIFYQFQKPTSFKNHTQILVDRSNRPLTKRRLDQETLSIVGDKTIDSYPWDTLYIAANQLNWKPRPVIQSYISYTPYLDTQNEVFFRSAQAPKYLLWEKTHFGGDLGSIDGRYLLNDEPLTLLAILSNYVTAHETVDHILLKRAETPTLRRASVTSKKQYKWEEWIEAPNITTDSEDILRARITIKRTLFQKIKLLIYKEFDSYITYKFKNGEQSKYRLIIDNAQNGVWINPFQVQLLKFDQRNRVVAIKLTHSKGDTFLPYFDVAWERSEWVGKYNRN